MADIYVKHTSSNTANYDTWAKAATALSSAAGIDAAGDNIYLSSTHSESTASALVFALAGTVASPTTILSVNDAAEPPTASASGATITTTVNSGIQFTGTAFYVEGVTFQCGSGANSPILYGSSNTAASRAKFTDCNFYIVATGGSARTEVGAQAGGVADWNNCNIRFAASGQGLRLIAAARFRWDGGAAVSGGTSPTTLFATAGAAGARAEISGVDLSAFSSGLNLVTAGGANTRYVFRNCKLPASWSGSLTTGTLVVSERHEMHNCDSGDTNYRLLIADYLGTIRSETTIVRSGGASDGTTAFSWAMVSNANAKFPLLPLLSPEISAWNDTTGSSVTVTVEIITDNVTLNNDECWLEVQYLGTSGFPLGSFATDVKSDVLATAAAQTSSSETWTTTGLTTPVKQKLSVSFTPQEKGYLQAVVKLAKASTTVYVDPKLTVT